MGVVRPMARMLETELTEKIGRLRRAEIRRLPHGHGELGRRSSRSWRPSKASPPALAMELSGMVSNAA